MCAWLTSMKVIPHPDTTIPRPTTSSCLVIPDACTRLAKLAWRMPFEVFDAFASSVATQFYESSRQHYFDEKMMRVHETYHAHYFVKLVPCKTYRELYTTLREYIMQFRVYNSRHERFQGSDVAPEPVLCAPVWTNKHGWACVLVSQYIQGCTVNHLRRFKMPLLPCCGVLGVQVPRAEIISAVEMTLKALWTLGFSHNDLHDKNIVYDPKTKRATLVDFETCVQMEGIHLAAFRESARDVKAYRQHYKEDARRSLEGIARWCCTFLDEDAEIQNPDDMCVTIMKGVLPKSMRV